MGGNANILRAAIMASGNGSNAENILRHAAAHPSKIEIPLVVCDKAGAGVIARAESAGAACAVIERTQGKKAQEDAILSALAAHNIEWIFLAGYMAILSPSFVAAYRGRIVNIHPSLLPAFPGRDGYGDAYRANVGESGVTLHYVDEGVDTGPIIAQARFERAAKDTLDEFRARGMRLEYKLYRDFIDHLIRERAA